MTEWFEQKSFKKLERDLNDPTKRIIPFVGAGLSIYGPPDDRLPDWYSLIKKLSERDGVSDEIQSEVKKLLEMGKYEYAANEIKDELGDAGFQQALEDILDTIDKEIPPAIGELAKIEWRAIITTNYDDFLKRAMKHQVINVITGADVSNLLDVVSGSNRTPTLVHLHGSIEPYKDVILSYDDYSRLIENNEAYTDCIKTLQSQTVLYIGFGMTDRDFDPILKKMVSQYKGRVGHHFTILPDHLKKTEKINDLVNMGAQMIWYKYDLGERDEPDCGHGEVLTILRSLVSIRQNDGEMLTILRRQKSESTALSIPLAYQNWIKHETPVALSSAYIPLCCDDFIREKNTECASTYPQEGHKNKDKRWLDGSVSGESPEREPVDIEKLIAREPYLLLEGGPGSGKTTLLRHLARTIIEEDAEPEINGFLPVLVYLKDLNTSASKITTLPAGITCAETLLSDFFRLKNNGLDQSILNAYCKSGRALFLIDGLDELDDKYQSLVVESFSAICDHHPNVKVVFTSRPHSVSVASNYFGDWHRKIHPLINEQIKSFITNWFKPIDDQGVEGGIKEADKLIKEIKDHPDVQELKSNPLMLTAICTVYWDSKKLPEQRADLYNRIIDNLLGKQCHNFTEPYFTDRVVEFLSDLAYTMREKRLSVIDRKETIAILKKYFHQKSAESLQDYRRRIAHLFDDDIQPKCGILYHSDGGYYFEIPTFHDFLAAEHLSNNLNAFVEFIQKVIGDIWWSETVCLLTGFLSIHTKRLANDIVDDIFSHGDPTNETNVEKWLIAGSAFRDISQPRRISGTLENVQNSLLAVMTKTPSYKLRFEAGELLGWIGDCRNLKRFELIPGGYYSFGEKRIHLDSFEISKFPVTNSWFREFIEAGGYNLTKPWWGEEDGLKQWIREGDVKSPKYWHELKWTCPNFPVVGVSWFEAKAFVNWLNFNNPEKMDYRLPTEYEWMAAAVGQCGLEYPWGKKLNPTDQDLCNFGSKFDSGPKLGRTSPVGMFPAGNTPEDISDLSGDVWEWCEDEYEVREHARVMKGGGFFNSAEFCGSLSRSYAYESDRFRDLGFRIVGPLI